MANKNIIMQEFNGTEYDTLYPQIIPSFNQDVNLNFNRIINVATPVQDSGVAVKSYVDSHSLKKYLIRQESATEVQQNFQIRCNHYLLSKNYISSIAFLFLEMSYYASSIPSATDVIQWKCWPKTENIINITKPYSGWPEQTSTYSFSAILFQNSWVNNSSYRGEKSTHYFLDNGFVFNVHLANSDSYVDEAFADIRKNEDGNYYLNYTWKMYAYLLPNYEI